VDVAELKQVLAKRVSGVAIVTARAGDVIHGMTVSAFTESPRAASVLVCATDLAHASGDRARRGSR
jgi:flavin reductase (DIM6/NTAB) family NADH-FMN oxidoreductase RutF